MSCGVSIGRLALDLADAVEDDDRVVDREADEGQERGDHRQVDLVADERHGPQGDQHVVDQGDDRRQRRRRPT